ncbi:MAG: hypothetical protein AAFO89_10295 [Planctomycetota bacterium]
MAAESEVKAGKECPLKIAFEYGTQPDTFRGFRRAVEVENPALDRVLVLARADGYRFEKIDSDGYVHNHVEKRDMSRLPDAEVCHSLTTEPTKRVLEVADSRWRPLPIEPRHASLAARQLPNGPERDLPFLGDQPPKQFDEAASFGKCRRNDSLFSERWQLTRQARGGCVVLARHCRANG